MNVWIARLKLLVLAGFGLACLALFFIVSLSFLAIGLALTVILVMLQFFQRLFTKKEKHPPIHIDEDGHLIIEHDPS